MRRLMTVAGEKRGWGSEVWAEEAAHRSGKLLATNPCTVRIVIPVWDGRISPVFDVSRRIHIMDVGQLGSALHSYDELPEECFLDRAYHLVNLGADVLLCGAISRPLKGALVSAGIDVISGLCGPVDEVCSAFLKGTLSDSNRMPGASRDKRESAFTVK